jgi:hypothetical protein
VWAQDRACTEGMGAIMDRTQEHLASSDLPVIKMRRLLIRVARQLEAAGTEPPGVRTVPRVAAIPTGPVPAGPALGTGRRGRDGADQAG